MTSFARTVAGDGGCPDLLVLGEGVGGYECTTFSELEMIVSIDDFDEPVETGTVLAAGGLKWDF